MPSGSFLPLVVLAAAALTAGRSLAEAIPVPPTRVTPPSCTPAACPAPANPCESPRMVCPPAPRIRVIVPPPEVEFRYANRAGCGSAGHGAVVAQPGAAVVPQACPSPARGGGQMTFNMNLQ